MGANILKDIFFDEKGHWDAFVKKNGRRIRSVVIEEVEKFRKCGDPRSGFSLLVCEGCHDIKLLPHRCKGRFCTSCATGETEEWSRLLQEDVFQVNHRHVIFTLDEGLREIFIQHRHLLKPLMDEAAGLIKNYFEKKHNVTPGIIAGLHTFGSRINFNPHVHMLVTMGGMKTDGEWKRYDYIPFEMLRKQWQTIVLKLIRKGLNEKEKKKVQPLLQKAYAANGKGFYVYAPKQTGNVKEQLAYIGRYIRRPAISMKRIESYDGEYVTFRYFDKTSKQDKLETVSVEEFIARLIRHIPDKQFKTIRHYGVYSRRLKKLSRTLVTEWQKTARKWIAKAKRMLKRKTWRERLKEGTGKDPMVCPKCECYYEYKGEVCLEQGNLQVKYAVCSNSRAVMERMIRDLTGIEEKTSQKKETATHHAKQVRPGENESQLYLFAM